MLFQCVPVNHVLVVAVTRCLRLLFRLRYLRLCALRRLLYFALLQGFLQLLRLLLLFFAIVSVFLGLHSVPSCSLWDGFRSA